MLKLLIGKLPARQQYKSKYKADKITKSNEKTAANQIKGAFQIIKAILIKDVIISCAVWAHTVYFD